jgi:pimeloyl-ACP methyl ester carboxylesterase
VRKLLALALALSALFGCSPLQTDGDFMFLRNAGADLPIWVRGNTESKTLVVWLSGGPGSPVNFVRGPATDEMERHFGMVYWDQRGAGSAQGNPSPESFTMEQFVEDTHKVVELVRERYGATRIFLLGHSWGGTLATAYLLDPERQRQIAGYLDVGGNHDMPLVFPFKLAWLRAYAETRIAAGSEVEHWTAVRDFCASNPPLTEENFSQWDDDTDGSNAAFHDPNAGPEVNFQRLFLSSDSPNAYLLVNKDLDEEYMFKTDAVRNGYSYSERMRDITLPVALLWGRNDGIVPLPTAYATFDSLGTPADRIAFTVFDRSAHFPFLEEPAAFAKAAVDFVQRER